MVNVQKVERPLKGPLGLIPIGPIKHSGVVVTTSDGKKYLVHKGDGYGKSSQTVVTDAKHMSNAWSNSGEGKRVNGKSVGDFVKAGGKNYDLRKDNCHDASGRMYNLGKRSSCS